MRGNLDRVDYDIVGYDASSLPGRSNNICNILRHTERKYMYTDKERLKNWLFLVRAKQKSLAGIQTLVEKHFQPVHLVFDKCSCSDSIARA